MARTNIPPSRLKRYEEKRMLHKLAAISVGSIILLLLLVIFGFKLLIGFSVFVSKFSGSNTPTQNDSGNIILPPFLDPLPLATSSGKIIVTGNSQPNTRIVLFINEEESKRVGVSEDGTFIISSLTLQEGSHTLKAIAEDEQKKQSEFSNILKISVIKKPPTLEVNQPEDGITINGDNNLYTVVGKTTEDVTVRINDRFVVVKPDGSFSYPYPLSEGENTLTITATDLAGNKTEVSRKVKYEK